MPTIAELERQRPQQRPQQRRRPAAQRRQPTGRARTLPANATVAGRPTNATLTRPGAPSTLAAPQPQQPQQPQQPATQPFGPAQQAQQQAAQALQQAGMLAGAPATQPFGPGQDLRSTQINPTQSPVTQRAGSLAEQAINAMFNSPDRAQLAADTLGTFEEQLGDARRTGIQDIGREAASLGRIGSGVTTSQLGDLELQLGRERQRMESQLATDAAQQALADQQARLQGALGAQGQFFGQEAAGREELRGERGFQQAMAQQALQDYMNMLQMQETLTQGQFGREKARLDQILGTGFGGAAGGGADTLISGVGKFPEAQPIDWTGIGSAIGGIFE